MISAFSYVKRLGDELEKLRSEGRNTNYTGHIKTLLKIEYDSDDYQRVFAEVDTAAADIKYCLPNITSVNDALKRLVTGRWVYTAADYREEKIREIVGDDLCLQKEAIEILTNFHNRGAYILYFVLKDLQSYYKENQEADDFNQDDKKFESVKDNEYFESLYEVYRRIDAFRGTKDLWMSALIRECREKLKYLFGGNMNDALKYVVSKKFYDYRTRDFMWRVFSGQEICSNIPERRENAE